MLGALASSPLSEIVNTVLDLAHGQLCCDTYVVVDVAGRKDASLQYTVVVAVINDKQAPGSYK